MSVLVDSSVWINYFRGSDDSKSMDELLGEGLVVINDLILAELVPSLMVRGERRLVRLLREIERLPLEGDWEALIALQVTCLQNGINKAGLPDLMIARCAIRHRLPLLSHDRHFALLAEVTPLSLYETS
jgi:predicted nucleic acid-binding protein